MRKYTLMVIGLDLVQMMVDSDMSIVQEAVNGGYAPPIPPE